MDDRRKNILLVSFDDCSAYWKYKSAFGEPLHTPNLDKFCATSTAFHSAYCQAPVCGPSRASFMSGKLPPETGIFDNSTDVFEHVPAETFWTYTLKQSGYFCSSGGKVHHKYKPVNRRVQAILYSDERKHFEADMHMPPGVDKKKYGGNRGGWGTTNEKDDVTYYDYQTANSCIQFLEDYDRPEPFYRELGFYSPHGPHYTPSRFKEMYKERRFRVPDSWEKGYRKNAFAEEHFPPNIDPEDRKWWQRSVRNYFSALSHGDYHFGRVMDALRASRHAENTVVIVISDHGFHLGNLNRYKKTTMWEQVAGIPMIIHDPDQPEGREVHDPVAAIDVGPTVLDYAGLPAPEGNIIGRSLRPMVYGHSDPDRVVPTFYFGNMSIRKSDYRFIRYADGTSQLYDLRDDFWQLHDLGEDHPAHGDMLDSLLDCAQLCGASNEPEG